jgi:hypothetical protein
MDWLITLGLFSVLALAMTITALLTDRASRSRR